MPKYYFDYKERDGEQDSGWLLRGAPQSFEPTWRGLLLAHDVLEHFPTDDGSFEAELMAFGATIRGRGLGGYFGKHSPFASTSTAESVIYNDMTYFFSRLSKKVVRCAPRRPLPLSFEAERIITEVLDRTHNQELHSFASEIASWMRIGYLRASRRYRDHSPREISRFFEEVQNQLTSGFHDFFAAKIFAATVNFKDLSIDVKMQ